MGAALVGWLISIFGWRTSFIVVGAVGFVWLIAWFAWYGKPEDSKFVGEAERNKILGEREADKSGSSVHVEGGGTLGLLRSPTMLGLSLTQGCAVYTQYFFLTWLPNYLQTERGMSLLKSGALMSLPFLGAVILTVCLGKLSDGLLTEESARAGGVPIGAALVDGARVVAVGHNRRVQHGDPIAHGEMDCLRNAGRQKSYRGMTLYTTLSPCMMCTGTILQFKIKRVVIGENRTFGGDHDHAGGVVAGRTIQCRHKGSHQF